MRFLFPKVDCYIISHLKPLYLEQAIESALNQTWKNVQITVVDSGAWRWPNRNTELASAFCDIRDRFVTGKEVEWIETGEHPDDHKKHSMPSRIMNYIVKNNISNGEYLFFLCDDDLVYAPYVEKMFGALDADENKEIVYCGQLRKRNTKDAGHAIMPFGEVTGKRFDCVLDYLQVVTRKDTIKSLEYPYWSESLDGTEKHADGIFFNKLGDMGKVFYPINEVLCENRRTPLSTFCPSSF